MDAGAPNLYAESAVQWLATHLQSQHGGGIGLDSGKLPQGITDRRLARVIDYMHAHYPEPVSLECLAGEAGISKFHFTRLFRAATRETPHECLVHVRLEAARVLLMTTELSVEAVAAKCGFARATYFATTFAKHYGQTPKSYRARGRTRG